MSNSPLVTYVHITKHKNSGRGGKKIEKIFLHHMAGNLTVKQCGNVFDTRQASAHYGVNGSAIGQYVDEKDTAWHCGNFPWNQKSIGIELANDGGAKSNWHVSDQTIQTAIRLIADICKRNGISVLHYTGDMNGNLCMHRWVCSTSCPGPYLAQKFVYIATEVNKLLNAKPEPIKLDVDGIGGPLTVTRMQEFLGTLQDGVISGQNESLAKHYPSLEAVVFDDTESTCIKHLQWVVGVYEDGVIGPDTVRAWQKFLGVEADGIFGPISMQAWQKYLNEHDKAVFPTTHAPKPVTAPKPVASAPVGNGSPIVAKAKEYAWAYGTKSSKYSYSKGSAKASYKAALKKFMGKKAKISQTDCGYFASTCARAAGHKGFLALPGSAKDAYPKLPSSMFIAQSGGASGLKAGDIIRYRKTNGHQHVVVYLGDGKIAHASRKHAFPRIAKAKPWTGKGVKKPSLQVIRAK